MRKKLSPDETESQSLAKARPSVLANASISLVGHMAWRTKDLSWRGPMILTLYYYYFPLLFIFRYNYTGAFSLLFVSFCGRRKSPVLISVVFFFTLISNLDRMSYFPHGMLVSRWLTLFTIK